MKVNMNKIEDGFGAVEGLLIVIVILFVGFIGFYVWNSNSNNSKNTGQNTQPTNTIKPATKVTTDMPTPPADTATYVKITEWSVKIPVDSKTKGLSYKLGSSSPTGGQGASFSSDDLKLVSRAGCESNVVNVLRGTKTQFVAQEVGSSTTTFEDQYNITKTNESYYIGVKVGEYYLVNPNFRGASCATADNGNKEQGAVEAIQASIRKAIAD